MTVIVWDGTTLAADSMTTAGDIRIQNSRKIRKIHDALVGTAGRSDDGLLFERWFKLGCNPAEKPVLDEEFCAIAVTKNGAYVYFDKLVPIKMAPPVAIGCGYVPALAALKAGADARKAVAIACELDIHCARPILCKNL
ncbi:MAG: hypothetical protein K2W95_00930 [Candidatus Obscuribacterales bacterium]|nr:hypothetical protein [Candidatus Obscuribacterales bacterium]